MHRLKAVVLVFISIAVVVLTAEFMAYILLVMGVEERNFDFGFYTEDVPSPFEVPSHIFSHKRMSSEELHVHQPGQRIWPTHISVDGIQQLQANKESNFKSLNLDGSLMHEYHVAADEFGRRKTTKLNRRKHLVVMGCSYVYGEGLNQEETIPEQLQNLVQDFRAYNLGYIGYTVDDIYIRSKKQNFMGNISQKEGVGIYVVMADHIRRSFGAMRDDWRLEKIKLVQDGEYSFESQGVYRDDLKGAMWIFYYFANSHFARLFNLDYPFSTSARVDLFVRKIKALEVIYKQNFLESNAFYVVLYPDTFDAPVRFYLRKYLDKHKIYFLDYSRYSINEFLQPLPRLKDGHPDGRANRFFSELLVEDLRLK